LMKRKATVSIYPHTLSLLGWHDKRVGGVAVFSKHKPSSVRYGLPNYRGRVLSLTFGSAFTLLCCYSPNAGARLARLDTKQHFNALMEHHIQTLQQQGAPVIWAG
jgi:exonuclease III